jgi:hypothetical protein
MENTVQTRNSREFPKPDSAHLQKPTSKALMVKK